MRDNHSTNAHSFFFGFCSTEKKRLLSLHPSPTDALIFSPIIVALSLVISALVTIFGLYIYRFGASLAKLPHFRHSKSPPSLLRPSLNASSRPATYPPMSSPLPHTAYQPVVFAGPSGVGKGTIVGILMKEYPQLFGFSTSHTTRDPRPGETNGNTILLVSFTYSKFIIMVFRCAL